MDCEETGSKHFTLHRLQFIILKTTGQVIGYVHSVTLLILFVLANERFQEWPPCFSNRNKVACPLFLVSLQQIE